MKIEKVWVVFEGKHRQFKVLNTKLAGASPFQALLS